jgi:hypothetical protein
MTTLTELINNLPAEQKTKTKNIEFQYDNQQKPSFSDNKLIIYDYDNNNKSLLKDDLDLSSFANLRNIDFQYNVRASLLENIDISENKNLCKIIIGQNNQHSPLQNSNAFLTVKKKQLNQIMVRYFYYDSNRG